MNHIMQERRAQPRARLGAGFEVLVDHQSYPATLYDISVAGLQARIDPMTFDEIREKIDGVRFTGHPPLAIRLQWGFFDGRFGAAFREPLIAGPEIEGYLASLSGS